MLINKLIFCDVNVLNDSEKFEELLSYYNYAFNFDCALDFIFLMIEEPLVVCSVQSSFFYYIIDSLESEFTSENVNFASKGEVVILEGNYVMINKKDIGSKINIYCVEKPLIVDNIKLTELLKKKFAKYVSTHDDYYLGYDKRYTEVYQKGATTWEAITPNQSLLVMLRDNIELFKNKKIIDLGCGEGRDTIFLTEQGIDVVGVDISTSALSKARDISKNRKINAKFIESNVIYLNGIPDDYFDTAINMGCLHMIVKYEERISHIGNVYRILKSGGVFIIDHCQGNWGKGFFSLSGDLYNKDRLIVGESIERRIRTENGEAVVPLEVIPYSEMKEDVLTKEVCSVGFKKLFSVISDTEAFGNSVLVVFEK